MSAPATLDSLAVGDRIWFVEERMPYTVQARSPRFLICTKPFACQHTVLYCIVDIQKEYRGPEDLVFGHGAETPEQCERMLARLESLDENNQSGISRRRSLQLRVKKLERRAA